MLTPVILYTVPVQIIFMSAKYQNFDDGSGLAPENKGKSNKNSSSEAFIWCSLRYIHIMYTCVQAYHCHLCLILI